MFSIFLQGFHYNKQLLFCYCIPLLRVCWFMAVGGNWFVVLDNNFSYMEFTSIRMDINFLLKSGYINKAPQVNIHLISSNDFFSTSVHLKFTFFDVNAVKGCNKCDRLDHIYLSTLLSL